MPTHLKVAKVLSLFLLLVPFAAGDDKNDFWLAARQGDTKTVEAMLAKGVDVNTKFRYGATALSYACDHTHADVVKVLLAHGADVNVKDTFYGATPLSWAVQRGSTDITKMLLEKGATGRDDALIGSVFSGKAEFIKLILDAGGIKPETLSAALAQATRAKKDDIVELLKKYGARPVEAKVQVSDEVLKSYEGSYKGEGGPDFVISFKEGHLVADVQGQKVNLSAESTTAFRAVEFPTVSLAFEVKDGKATGFTMKQGSNNITYTRQEKP